ncbi:AAA family ATPase [Desulfobacter curvatus]|uniref:AAA family ATPase n=1 Tax=Desulfobacter curvatus TaxID=2290 RepID=UPI000372763B|nr:AAA family ATPase [Desulfobacter curvatus]
MKYLYSKTDKKNLKWFCKDESKKTLLSLNLKRGKIRGLSPFHLEFKYPISVIAGKNGSGKSTILAIAACAFHNYSKGYKLLSRKTPYYTFSDFFIQSSDEISPDGIEIRYSFLHNHWKSKGSKSISGVRSQYRKKKKGGRWNDYSRRIKRNVVYLGIDRVVPHYEKSVSKSYRKTFKKMEDEGWEEDVKNIVGRILNKQYKKFWYTKWSKYRLPVVQIKDSLYSGFNMGAGENALFEIFSTIFSCDDGLFLIIDEIELGLHEKAQKKFIKELKDICLRKHIQILCTTHSSVILENTPPEGRFYLECFENNTVMTPEISSRYARGKMSGENSNELDIFIEDETAESILEGVLNHEQRQRVNLISIGSSSAIIRQMAARYKEIKKGNCIAIMDGDKYNQCSNHKKLFLQALETYEDEESASAWFTNRVSFLPGDEWPEKWLIETLLDGNKEIEELFSIDTDMFAGIIEEALESGKHNEIYTVANELNLNLDYVKRTLSNWAAKEYHYDFYEVKELIATALKR